MQQPDPFIATLREWVEIFMRRSMRSYILYSKETGLSMSQIGALFQIHHKGVSGVSDLGEHLGVTSAAASQMLERLVQQGLILRSEDPNDRRAKQLVITEKGNQIIRESMQARQSWIDELSVTLSDGEKQQLIDALHILIEKTRALESQPAPEH
jgi:DNA-binding MarR family transcriptional regulator